MLKRIFDITFSFFAIVLVGFFVFLFWIFASIDTFSNGLFVQERVGQFGQMFQIYKLKSIQNNSNKISKFGRFIRKHKIDELPQLWNVFIGNMSVVGPRPDIAGYYDKLIGAERKLLNLKPGLTSQASLKYYNEEIILANKKNPHEYNDRIIFPDKVKMNLEYLENQSFMLDLKIIFQTIFANKKNIY